MIVINMRQDFTLGEFSQLMNEAKPLFSITTNLSFFEIKILNNLLLIQEKQYYCKPVCNHEGNRYSLSLVLEIAQNKLHKNAILMNKRIDESMCEINYYYIFYLS